MYATLEEEAMTTNAVTKVLITQTTSDGLIEAVAKAPEQHPGSFAAVCRLRGLSRITASWRRWQHPACRISKRFEPHLAQENRCSGNRDDSQTRRWKW